MIKAVGRNALGTPMIILGLSGENMARLMAGEPIRVDPRELGLQYLDIVIVGGRTEEDIAQQLSDAGLIDSATKIRHD